jgi:hypothetical protein
MFSTGLPSRSSPRLHPRAPGFASAKASARQSSLSSATRAKTGGKEITLPLVQPKCAYRADFYLHACGFGGKGIRTPGLLIANETLYQLSYTPGRRSENITTSRFVSNRNHNRARHFASCPSTVASYATGYGEPKGKGLLLLRLWPQTTAKSGLAFMRANRKRLNRIAFGLVELTRSISDLNSTNHKPKEI